MWSWIILLGITVAMAAAAHSVLRKQPFISGVLAGTGGLGTNGTGAGAAATSSTPAGAGTVGGGGGGGLGN